MILLDVNDLVVAYGHIVAVRGVSFAVHDGEVVALLGANGAGKSTTLGAISGLIPPKSGTVTVNGTPVTRLRPERIVRAGVAHVPQGRQIFGTLSVIDNLRLGASPRRDRRNIRADLDAIFGRFPVLSTYAHRRASSLSGGEQQQLAIARALLSRPRILLLDEPSLGLAPLMVDTVFDALADLRRTGVTILIVEQNAQRALAFADRSYVIRRGEISFQGTRAEMARVPDLMEAYVGG